MSLSSILSKQQESRIFGLDILRSSAILLVLYSHGFDPFLAEYFPKLRLLIFMDGVDLFFVLSGFLIGLILIKQFEKNVDYTFLPIFDFWKRRWRRTLKINDHIVTWDSHIRRVVFIRLDSTMYGVLGAFLKFYYSKLWEKKSLFIYVNLMGIICLFITQFAYLAPINSHTNIFMNTLYFSISGIGVIFLLPQINSLKIPPRSGITGIIGKIITHISLISYSRYLTHRYLILGHFIRYKNEYFDQQLPHSLFVESFILVVIY